ncbi:capsular polysaccharide biosynthesis protein [Desulfovibrio sp. An276]|uniref:capsular polysaccharide biosynthesis protein n=1 Tax=Desulfovibrio sp. An276 TaxID=1965618 RepID=UPI001EF5964D|nr:capsular polysaccharide biosynthesis protein [Desulfovibrio sp. An276]
MIIYFSKKIPLHIVKVFLKYKENNNDIYHFTIGWGHKITANKARRYAAQHNLPYIALEDGFLRSLDLGCSGVQPLSLVIDHTGIYYDATEPSDLENLLNSSDWENPALLDSARRAMKDINRYHLSKYNHAPDISSDLWGNAPSPHVLVLDQTVGDASVSLGMASEASFKAMLDEVLSLYPRDSIQVKTHPDVIARKKHGFLADYAKSRGVQIISLNCSPLSLLAQADVVYTVTSQMGFEALMLGKEVHCFGMPFYAGWGLTIDKQICPRRTRRRSLEDVFAAAYMLYARYVNPIREERCDVHETISLLAEQRRQNERNRTFHACLGFRWWKKPYALAYLKSTGGETAFFRNPKRAIAQAKARGGEVVVWSSAVTDALQQQCDRESVALARMEDGFIRSVGLGSDFNWPYSLVVDRKGIYYDPTRPSGLEDLLNTLPDHPDHNVLLARAASLRSLILEKGLTKYNTGLTDISLPYLPEDKTIVLVPGQVEDDASVRKGGFGMDNLSLLQRAREKRPDAFIIYKPHPDVERGNRKGRIAEEIALRYADIIVRNYPMGQLLPKVHEVHTLTSQTGFEALLRGVKVCTYGGPFYAGWGLTEDTQTFPRRTAHLTLDELVAGTLLLYPTYYDWQTENFCRAEDVCFRLLQPNGQMRGRIWARFVNFIRNKLRRRG